jgi:hypothetical protein
MKREEKQEQSDSEIFRLSPLPFIVDVKSNHFHLFSSCFFLNGLRQHEIVDDIISLRFFFDTSKTRERKNKER